ncbi:MAG: hypothetical protein Q8N93_05125 [Bacillota bacterium]|nr:hypothetical protein [Bacillota bacterium]
MQDIFTSEIDAARRQELLRTIQQVVTVEKGRELEVLPDTGPGSVPEVLISFWFFL